MCKSKYSFSLLSIFFVLLMGTSVYPLRNSTSHYAGHTDDITEEGGHIDTELQNGEEKVGIIGSILAVLGKIVRWFSELSFFSSERRRITDTEVRNGEEKVGIIGSILDVPGKFVRWLSEFSFFSSERWRITGPDCAMVKSPKVSEGHGSEPDIVDNKYSGNEGWQCNLMDKDRQRIGLDENANTCRVNEMEPWPYCALVNSSKVSESHGTEDKSNRCNQKKSYMPIRRKEKTRRDIPGPADQYESDVSDKTSAGDEGRPINIADKDRQRMGLDENANSRRVTKMEVFRAPMEQRTSYVPHAIALLTVLTFGYCALRHRIKQTTYPDVSKVSKQRQKGATDSDIDRYLKLDADQDQVGSQSVRGTHSLVERERTIINNAGEDPLDALQELGIQSLDESKTDNDVEQLHKRHLRDQSKHWKGTENEGSVLTEKRNFDDFYTDLSVIATPRDRLFIEPDVMQEENSKQDIQVDLHQLFRSDKSSTNNTIITVVCGAAGTGKSTIIQKIVRDWSTGSMFKQFKFVLHFPLRQLNGIKRKTNLNKLIFDTYPHFKSNLEHLWREPNNILFILDDFDQFEGIVYYRDKVKKENQPKKYLEPQSVCLVSDIVHSLLQGNLLKGCSVLITTRPWNLETLNEAPIDSTFQIIGFTAGHLKQYFNRFLGDGLQAENVIKRTEQSDILRNMCRNPLFCSVLCPYLKSQQIQGEGTTCVICNTRVLSDFFALLLHRSGYNVKTSRNSFSKLGELAYTGICNKTFSFESDKLSDLNLYLPNFASTFMIQVQNNDRTASVYKFPHSFFQDFVAAVSKRLHTPGDKLQRMLDETFTSGDDRLIICSRFMVGLCSGKSSDYLEGLLGKFISDVSLRISNWLSETIKRRIENLERKYTQNTFLNILHFLFEFGDMQLTKNILTGIPAIKFNQCVLRPSDCTVISATLTCSESVTEMDLSSCRLQLAGIQQLEPVLHKCEILRLNGNDLKDAGVKFLSEVLKRNDCNVQRLELKSNKLTDDCLEDLFSTLAGNRSLTELDLSNSKQQEEEANRFTTDRLQNVIQSSDLKKEIRLIRSRDLKQNTSKDETALNVLTVITE